MKDARNQYIFNVATDANKIEIRYAIEKRFSVKVESIRTENVKPKPRQRFTKGGRVQGYTSHWKKATVTLKQGDTIDFFEGV